MPAWWESLSTFQQIMFAIAVPATLILFIFLILMIIGIDGSDAFAGDLDVDLDISDIDSINAEPITDISGLRILTIRGALTFLSIGAWMAYILDNYLQSWLAGLIGIISGAVAAFLVALAFKASLRLENEGNIDYRNSIGKTGVAYLRIPAKRAGKGKVNVVVQGRYVEIDAITDEEEVISTGSNIVVVDVLNDTTVIVKQVKEK